MAPTPLTPISEESLPNYPEMKIRHDNNNSASKNSGEDQGCLYFYDRPEPKGSFQEDSFFKNAQLNYEKAVEDMMSNRGTIDASTGAPENLSAYRNLCQDGDKQDSRASGLTDLGQQYQVRYKIIQYVIVLITKLLYYFLLTFAIIFLRNYIFSVPKHNNIDNSLLFS